MCSDWAQNVKRSRDGERDSLLSRLVQKYVWCCRFLSSHAHVISRIGRRLSRAGYHEEDLECAYWELVRVVEDYLHRYNFRLTRYRESFFRRHIFQTLIFSAYL